jgi:acyl-CoA thioester hydrolase
MTHHSDPPSREVTLTGATQWRVYYEDTDFSGYVYHANYLKFFERAREELIGIENVRGYFRQGLHFVVARLDVRFHLPAKHADLLTVKTTMQFSESPVVQTTQEAWRGEQKLVSATLKLAAVNEMGEPVRIPDGILSGLRAQQP